MKKSLRYIILFILINIFSINNVYGYGSFTQTSDPQYSQSVVDNDVITSSNWNSVVYDISNIITDIGSLKTYIDANLVSFFRDNGTTLSYSEKDVHIGKNLEIGGDITVEHLDIDLGNISNDVIITDDIKNGNLLQEDLDPNIDYGQDNVFKKKNGILYYKDGNIAIGDTTAKEQFKIKNGGIKIMGTGNGIIFGDGTKVTTLPVLSNDNMLTIGNQNIDGTKKFIDGIKLNKYYAEDIFKMPIDQAHGDILKSHGDGGYLEDNGNLYYYKSSSGSAEYDSSEKRTGKFTLKAHIEPNQYIEIKVNSRGYHGDTNELPKLLPNTTYRTGIWVKTALTGDSDHGAMVRILTHDASGASTGEYDLIPWKKGTTPWTFYESTFTTGSTTTTGHVEFRIYGHTGAKTLKGDVWFDVNSFYIVPLINTEKHITKISKVIEPTTINKDEDIKTVLTEKAITDYLGTKTTKINGECSYLQEYSYNQKKPVVGFCNIGEMSNLHEIPATYNYGWTCSGINNGDSVECKTKECIVEMITESYTVDVEKTRTVNKTTTKPDIKGTGTRGRSSNSRYTEDFIIPEGTTSVKLTALFERNEESCCDRSQFWLYKNDSSIKDFGSKTSRGSQSINETITVSGGDKIKLRLQKRHDGSVNRGDSYIKNVKFEYIGVEKYTVTETRTKTYDKNFCETGGEEELKYNISGNVSEEAAGLKLTGCGTEEATVDSNGDFVFENIEEGTDCSNIQFENNLKGCEIKENGPNEVTDDYSSVSGRCIQTVDVKGGKLFAIELTTSNISRIERVNKCKSVNPNARAVVMGYSNNSNLTNYYRYAVHPNGNAIFQNGACRGGNDSATSSLLNNILNDGDQIFVYGCGTSDNISSINSYKRHSKRTRSGTNWSRNYNNGFSGNENSTFGTTGTVGKLHILCSYND